MTATFSRRHVALALATALVALVPAVHAADAFAALARPALAVKAPEHQVMQAAAQAGDRVVVAGERGVVVLSDDGGKTWRQARAVPVSTTLTSLAFVDAQTGWAVGHGGVVLHTRDGGETWVQQADGQTLARAAVQAAEAALQRNPGSAVAQRALKDAQGLLADGPDKPLLDVHFQDARHGWVVGAYNLFFETTDGGATWRGMGDRLDNPRGLHLYAIRSLGPSVFIVGEQGQMHRSRDGGQRFEALASPYKGSWFTLALSGDAVVVAGLRGNAFRSPDGGHTWAPLQGTSTAASFLSATTLGDGSVLLANQAGQLYALRQGTHLNALPAPPMPPLTHLLVLRDGGWLVTTLGGVLRLETTGPNGASK